MNKSRKALIFGATGNIGGAASRELLRRGWQVRAVTRNPESAKARALANLGAELFKADMDDRASVESAIDGIGHVFSVQNWSTNPDGPAGEIRQGRLVAAAAKAAGVEHLVYGSAGSGETDTGVPHFQAKLEVENYMRKLDLPFSVLRPGPFMELLTEKEFFPAMAAWGAEPKVTGWQLPLPWVAVHDLGIAVAEMFDRSYTWLGRDVTLFGDVKSLSECRAIFTEINGKAPSRLPVPLWLFRRMAGDEFVIMWRWIVDYIGAQGPGPLWQIVETSRQLSPGLLDLKSWLTLKQQPSHENPVLSQAGA